jgi:hypothetical protein
MRAKNVTVSGLNVLRIISVGPQVIAGRGNRIRFRGRKFYEYNSG